MDELRRRVLDATYRLLVFDGRDSADLTADELDEFQASAAELHAAGVELRNTMQAELDRRHGVE